MHEANNDMNKIVSAQIMAHLNYSEDAKQYGPNNSRVAKADKPI